MEIVGYQKGTPEFPPAFGDHNSDYKSTPDGVTPATLTLSTALVGSMMLLIQLLNRNWWNAPTDDNGNTVGSAIYDQDGYYAAQWSPYGMRVYAYPIAVGGPGHVVRYTNVSNPTDENTFIAAEIMGATLLRASSLVLRQANGAGVPYSSGALTIPGPAVLVSVWAGDGATGDHSATPDADWTKFDSVNRPNASYIQAACAYKVIADPGQYVCNWAPTSNEGAIVFLGAFQ